LIAVLCLIFSFVAGRISLPRGCIGLCSQGLEEESHVVHGAHLFIVAIDMKAGLEKVAVAERNGANFSLCSMAWGGFP
jgi:hypothetical protein